ncbi:Hsp33 family molecular chaperone HslO [Sandaracinobacteroides saxicola]|uniref:Hsp33 family molecular chaperone HslO n=1 Tax=Sandaracinobacteroides saxicola TaxID=2759707 RepID=UPI001FB185AF|nr:Hsp33 family molecular chaperone HslO [Sandaracinobacteroides saxicola]
MSDAILGFTIPGRGARGRLVRLDGVSAEILAAHDYPAACSALLGEALALTALMGSLLRQDEGQVTVQAQAQGGPVSMLVADYRPVGAMAEVRGYLQHGAGAATGASLPDLFGEGYLAITLEATAAAERYQGIVPLEGATLAEAAEAYFNGSEQLPTLVRLAAAPGANGWRAAGLLLQHLPRGEVDAPRLGVSGDVPGVPADWAHVAALAGTVTADELLDAGLPFDALLWRLFNEDEVRVTPPVTVVKGCRCSLPYIRGVLAGFPEEERLAMRGDDGLIGVDCGFCARRFELAL